MISLSHGGIRIGRPGAFAVVGNDLLNNSQGVEDMWIDQITETFSGVADQVVLFSKGSVTGLVIQNQGQNELKIKVGEAGNELVIAVPAQESFGGYFPPFTRLQVLATSAYSGFVTKGVERK